MSRTLVAYYSRTGNTRRVAHEIRDLLHADVEEILEADDHTGVFGWVRSIGEAVFHRKPRLLPTVCDPARYDLVFVGGPIWMGRLAPAVRAWMARSGPSMARVAFFATQNSPSVPAAWRDLEQVGATHPVATHSVRMRAVPDPVRHAELARFVTRAQRAPAGAFDAHAGRPHQRPVHG